VSFLKKSQVVAAVHREQRIHTAIGRLLDIEAQGLRSQQQVARSLGNLLGRAHLAAGIVATRVMQELFGVKKRLHELLLDKHRTCGSWLACDGGESGSTLLSDSAQSQASQLPQGCGVGL